MERTGPTAPVDWVVLEVREERGMFWPRVQFF